LHATALLQDLEVTSLTPAITGLVTNGFQQNLGAQVRPKQGETMVDYVDFAGNKIFADAGRGNGWLVLASVFTW
jgi:hypothetical protein